MSKMRARERLDLAVAALEWANPMLAESETPEMLDIDKLVEGIRLALEARKTEAIVELAARRHRAKEL
jgi:hypothetical protein